MLDGRLGVGMKAGGRYGVCACTSNAGNAARKILIENILGTRECVVEAKGATRRQQLVEERDPLDGLYYHCHDVPDDLNQRYNSFLFPIWM